MYLTLRPLLFKLDAERAHGLTLRLLRIAGDFALSRLILRRLWALNDPTLAVDAFGLHFANRVGLAAGYDKNGVAVRGLACLGFGHIEIGTVTRTAQIGNPKPRIHRAVAQQALLNSMGFPNAGVAALRIPSDTGARIGVNIGKSRDTPVEHAVEDYCALLAQVYRQADYVTLNVSSPNTSNLRQLQAHAAMTELLDAVTAVRNELTPRVPLLVKIAPDLTHAEIDAVLDAVSQNGVDGIIATNTTAQRSGLPATMHGLPGGVSGAPLRAQSTAVVRYIAEQTAGRLPLIGVGGILSVADALEKFEAGAWLVQLYTGLIYSGPGLVRQINLALRSRAMK